jgi:hypothetical protein
VRFATSRTTVQGDFTVRDYEAPYEQYVEYQVTSDTGKTVLSNAVQIMPTRPWIIYPGAPANSRQIMIQNVEPITRTIDRGVFRPAGRREAIVISDRRRSAEGTVTVMVDNLEDRDAIIEMCDLGQVLLLNCPSSLGYDLGYNYIAVGDVVETRPIRMLQSDYRYITLPYVVTSMPAELQGTAFTWEDVLTEQLTWKTLKKNFKSWTEVTKHREYQ